MTTIVRADRTCIACPSQWDAWDTDGRYLYMRYRSGIGTVDTYDNPDWETWTTPPDGDIARFDTEQRHDGDIGIEDFLDLAGLALADNAVVVGE